MAPIRHTQQRDTIRRSGTASTSVTGEGRIAGFSFDALRPDGQVLLRGGFVFVVLAGGAASLWPLAQTVALALALLLVPIVTRRLRPVWLTPALDVALLAPLLRMTGGSDSPFLFIVYLWFFGLALGMSSFERASRIVTLAGAMLLVLIAGTAGTDGWTVQVALHGLGLATAALLAFNLVRERRKGDRDPLTNLLHRRSGMAMLHERSRKNQPFTLAFIDLKHFKSVNDTYGHAIGDEVMRAVARRIRSSVRSGDLVMRYGGDEFVVATELDGIGARLHETLQAPIRTSRGVLTIRADVGEVRWKPGTDIAQVLRMADEEMYRNKSGSGTSKTQLRNLVLFTAETPPSSLRNRADAPTLFEAADRHAGSSPERRGANPQGEPGVFLSSDRLPRPPRAGPSVRRDPGEPFGTNSKHTPLDDLLYYSSDRWPEPEREPR